MRLRSWAPVGLILLLVVGIKGAADLQLDAMLAESLHEDRMAWSNAAMMEYFRPVPTVASADRYTGPVGHRERHLDGVIQTVYGPVPVIREVYIPAFVPPADNAFRGAFGFGATTLAECRDSVYYGPDGTHGNADDWPLNVYVVDPSTTLNATLDGGLGAILSDSVSDKSLDFIIFTEGGHYDMDDLPSAEVNLDTDCMYITGGPGQGEGVVLYYHGSVFFPKVRIGKNGIVHDVLLRDTKMWGDTGSGAGFNPVLAVSKYNRIYVDHVSDHSGTGKLLTLSTTGDTSSNITIAYSIIANASNGHVTTATQWSTWWRPGYAVEAKRHTYARNYVSIYSWRMPIWGAQQGDSASTVTGQWEWVNNISYKSAAPSDQFIMRTGGGVTIDILGSRFATYRSGIISRPIEWQESTTDPSIFISGSEFFLDHVSQGSDYDIAKKDDGSALPDSIKRSVRVTQPTDSIIPWTVAQVYDSLLSESPRVMVGAGRTLTCGGTYQANRDSTDQKQLDNYADNDSTYTADIFTGWDAAFVYRDTLIGTSACADADSPGDAGYGLPTSFETWSGITEADSMLGGYFAMEIYLNGDSAWLADLLGGGGSTATYETSPPRFVHIDSARWDTLWGPPDTFGVPQDTTPYYWPSLDSVPVGTIWAPLLLDDSLHVLIVTIDTLPSQERDSAWVDSVLTANTTLCNTRGACAPAFPRSMTIPGAP